MTGVRLMVDPPASGPANMAVDEALLRSAAHTGTTSLRFYAWSAPTLSLGYFQPAADREAHRPSGPCQLVRRSTGGGAIVHHRELTYSFAAPIDRRRTGSVARYYQAFHESLVATLKSHDLEAELCRTATDDDQFLCFARRSVGDVTLGDAKIAGSAQRRWQNAVLQHGSVILETSPYAPEIQGIRELGGKAVSSEILAIEWGQRVLEILQVAGHQQGLDSTERRWAERIEVERFGSSRWTLRR